MKTILLLVAALLLSGCATFGDTFHGWSKTDKALYDVSTVCITLDYLQTESALDTGKFEEGNPLMGRNPSDERLAALTGVRLGASWWLAERVDPTIRTEVFTIASILNCGVVLHNHAIGVRIKL